MRSNIVALALVAGAVRALPSNVKRQVTKLRDSYDFIIAGGGTAGLTIADRLTEAFPERTVLVVEYGGISYAPGQFDPPLAEEEVNSWDFESVPIPALNNRSAYVSVGRMVGGSSAINGMFFDRPSRHDFDDWHKAGGEEFEKAKVRWDWEGIFPFFRKSVTFTEPSKEDAEKYGYTWDLGAYGGSTPIYSTFPPYQWGAQKVGWNAWLELGVAARKECAMGDKDGLCWVPTSQNPLTARRSHAGLGHYAAVNTTRPNYDLLVKHKVRRVIYSNAKKDGPPLVEIVDLADGKAVNMSAKLEVVISAGAIHTPQILQRSGIGPEWLLKEAKIPMTKDLPGVGYNFHDHSGPGVSARLDSTAMRALSPSQADMNDPDFAADALKGWDETPARGPYTLAMGNSAIYASLPNITADYMTIVNKIRAMIADGSFKSYLPAGAAPSVVAGYAEQLRILADTFTNPTQPILESPFAAGAAGVAFLLKPLSRGTILLDPADPDGEPLLDYRTATNPIDLDIMVEFVRYFRKMFATKTLKTVYNAVESTPGVAVQTDEQIIEYLREEITMSFMHPCCTAAMLPEDKGGVVGPDLRVHGLPGLRVADLSVVPMLVAAHTSATAYAIGEKAADVIIKEYSTA